MRRYVLAGALIGFSACGGAGGGSTTPPATSPPAPAEVLSAAGLYSNIAAKQVDPRNRPFRPQYVLWSDAGVKRRWISLPAGTRIDTSDPERWVFPTGTKLWKEFSFVGRRVETRLIEKTGAEAGLGGWQFKSYQWRADESEAVLASAEGVPGASPTSFSSSHDIPSVNQCRLCHERGGDPILGFEALQLSADRDPLATQEGGLGADELTVETLVREGLVTTALDTRIRIAASRPAHRYVLGYLHANCGNCHNPRGASAALGMFFRHSLSAAREEDSPAYTTNLNRLTSVYTVPGNAIGTSFRIRGGSPEASAVFVRMQARGSAHAMPAFGSKVADAEALGLVAEWIRNLPR